MSAAAPAPEQKRDWKPVPKVQASLLAGALSTILIGALAWFDVDATPEIAAGLTTLLTFAAGYLKSP